MGVVGGYTALYDELVVWDARELGGTGVDVGTYCRKACLLARWGMELRPDLALPSGVMGPVDFCAFWRFAWIWAALAMA